MATITDLETLGYVVGQSSGSVAVEEEALAVAQGDAQPDVIRAQTVTVVQATVEQMSADGVLPADEAARGDMIALITGDVLDALTTRATDRIDFHQRAVESAREMPDTWHVEGWGTKVYVNCRPDGTGWDEGEQQLLDALADPSAHAERVWQFENTDAMEVASALKALGYLIARPELGADLFTVDGGAAMTSADLTTFAETATAKPTKEQLVAQALVDDPALSDATKQVIRAALGA